MTDTPPKARRPRADAERNRQSLLAAAKTLFERDGASASLEEIARTADVGIGTLYRHFPTRDALIEAVYRLAIDQLAEAAHRLAATRAPIDALREWLLVFIDYMSTKKLMAGLLATLPGGTGDLYAKSGPIMQNAAQKLMDNAEASGDIRSGIDPMDLLRALAGVVGNAGEQEAANARAMADILIAGLRRI